MLSTPVRLRKSSRQISLPFFSAAIKAGFPSPAETYVEHKLDFSDLMIRNPGASYLLQVSGDSMVGAGILSGDHVIVDRSIAPAHGDIVVAAVDGEFTLKRLYIKDGRTWLQAENPAFGPICCSESQELVIFGVVSRVVRVVKP